jgi:autophagy-related protein 2
VAIDSPSAHGDLPKSQLEGLQLWADEVSQLDALPFVERGYGGVTRDKDTSRFTSLIRSLFFAKSNGRSNDESGVDSTYLQARIETLINISLSEGLDMRWT